MVRTLVGTMLEQEPEQDRAAARRPAARRGRHDRAALGPLPRARSVLSRAWIRSGGALPERPLRPRRHADRLRGDHPRLVQARDAHRPARGRSPRPSWRRSSAARTSTTRCGRSTTAQADELVRVYREHNEPLHDELEAFEGIEHVLAELKGEGRRLGDRDGEAPPDGRARLRRPPARALLRRRRHLGHDRAPQAGPGAGARGARAARRRARARPRSSATRPSTSARARPRASTRSPSPGGTSTRSRRSAEADALVETPASSCSMSSRTGREAGRRAARAGRAPPLPLPRPRRPGDLGRRVRPALRRAAAARGGEPGARQRRTRRRSASARRPRTSSARSST